MSILDKFSLNSLLTQYLLTFVSFVLLTNLSSCFNSIVSFFGQLLVLSVISWHSIKNIRQYLDKKLITSHKRAVLITGCDSGLGKAAAFKLNEHGYKVYATVLHPDSEGTKNLVTGAQFQGMNKVVRMDVTNDEEVTAVYEQIKCDLQQNGEELWAVVNNEMFWQFGPIDWGTMQLYKNLFDVNTFGLIRVTRTFLPLIRESRGRIVNVSSTANRGAIIYSSNYSMAKMSVISFSDALRRENKKWGIKVSTVEPMGYKTELTKIESYKSVIDNNWKQTSDDVKQVYGQEFYENFRNNSFIVNKILKSSSNLEEVVDKIVDAIRKPEPRINYLVGNVIYEKFLLYLSQFLPTELNDLFDDMIEIMYN